MNNIWIQHEGYLTFSCYNGSAIVEEVDNGWHWLVDKLDDDIEWTDELYDNVELEGWWGMRDTEDAACQAAERALI